MENEDENTLEVLEEEELDTVEEVEATEDDELAKAQAEAAKYRRLFEKTLKPKVKEEKEQAISQPNIEETVLLANGLEEELLVQLKKVATINGTSLIKAQNDPIFVAVKEKFDKDKKRETASMPASRGAGQVKSKKDFSTPGLSREDHMALLKQALN